MHRQGVVRHRPGAAGSCTTTSRLFLSKKRRKRGKESFLGGHARHLGTQVAELVRIKGYNGRQDYPGHLALGVPNLSRRQRAHVFGRSALGPGPRTHQATLERTALAVKCACCSMSHRCTVLRSAS